MAKPFKPTLSGGTLPDYYQQVIFDIELAGQPVRICTKPGLPHWREATPVDHLIAEYIQPSPGENILLSGCGNGGVGVLLASRIAEGQLWLSDLTCIALECTRQTLALNHIENATVIHPSNILLDRKGQFDRAVIILPKGRKLARRWLLEAVESLKSEGQLYLSGANDEGIQSLCKDAASLTGSEGSVLGYKKGCRCVLFQKSTARQSPDWSQEDGIKPGSWYNFEFAVSGIKIRISSLPGVFSFDHVDDGSAFLLDNLEIKPGEVILDVGCGYGILGLAAYKMEPGNVKLVDLVDVNLLAEASARETIFQNTIQQERQVFRVLAGDLMRNLQNEYYSLVITNPPFHAGKAVDYVITQALIQEAHRVLKPGGRLLLVANRFIRYDKDISKYFVRTGILATNNRFHIFSAEKGR